MDKIIVYVDDADHAQQLLAPLAAKEPAHQRHWVLVACAPRMTHRVSKWVSHSARESWRNKWADKLFAQIIPGAERHMHIQRQWPYGLAAVTQGVEQVEGADLAVELHGSGVGRVARPRQVVAVNQICVPTNGVEHAGGPPDWLVGRV